MSGNNTTTPTNSREEENAFPYDANPGAALAFTIMFAISLLVHIFQAWRGRARYMLPLIFATVLQVVGYAFRYTVIGQPDQEVMDIMSEVFIIISPAIFAAQIYMVVGRMMSYVGPGSTFISHSIITKLFVGLDLVSIFTQTAGSIFVFAGDNNNPDIDRMNTGKNILVAGLVIQLIAFAFFVVVATLFHIKSRQLKGAELQPLKWLFTVIYMTSALILIRSVYRTIEFVQITFDGGEQQGYLVTTEWPYYVLDSVPILISTVLFNVVHPTGLLPVKKGERMDGTIEPPRKHWWSSAQSELKTVGSDSMLMEDRSRMV